MLLSTKALALAINCFLPLAAAASYDYCACQTKTDGALDDTKTSLVARSCGDSYSFVYGQFNKFQRHTVALNCLRQVRRMMTRILSSPGLDVKKVLGQDFKDYLCVSNFRC
ncbi:hypothetical protein FOMA001_g8687 [Fusarium oxysporum f. sp. matthiolae]|nr:hypothetical protein FOMA001_g8687 [Fusarium oxysporum f. sp. matthiolae]